MKRHLRSVFQKLDDWGQSSAGKSAERVLLAFSYVCMAFVAMLTAMFATGHLVVVPG